MSIGDSFSLKELQSIALILILNTLGVVMNSTIVYPTTTRERENLGSTFQNDGWKICCINKRRMVMKYSLLFCHGEDSGNTVANLAFLSVYKLIV